MTAPDSVTGDIATGIRSTASLHLRRSVGALVAAEDRARRLRLRRVAGLHCGPHRAHIAAAIAARLAERGGEVGALAEVERRIVAAAVAPDDFVDVDAERGRGIGIALALGIVRSVAAQQPPDPLAEGSCSGCTSPRAAEASNLRRPGVRIWGHCTTAAERRGAESRWRPRPNVPR